MFRFHRLHPRRRSSTFILITLLFTTLAAPWQIVSAGAQPMCPPPQIWDADLEDCVEIEQTVTPTEESAEPTATESTEPHADDTATETPAPDEPQPTMENEPTSASTGAEFSILGWDPFAFEGQPGPAIVMRAYSCNRSITAGDTLDSLTPDCFVISDATSAMGFDLYVNGQYAVTLDDSTYWSAGASPPIGEFGIQAHYPDDFRDPWADCDVTYLDDDIDVVSRYEYPWMQQDREVVKLPVTDPDARVFCMWFFAPNDVMSVDLYAYTCPGYVESIQYNDMIVACPLASNVEMQILSEDGVSSRLTDVGWAPFRNVQLGEVQVKGSQPTGYGNPLYYCMVTGPGGQTTKGLDIEIIGNQGYVTIDNNPPGGVVRCDVFYREN